MNAASSDNLAQRVVGFSKGWAVVLIIVGFLALLLPFEAGIAIAIAVAILIIAAGIIHLASTFAAKSAGAFLWRLLVGGVYLIAGVYLLVNPQLKLISLTLLLAVLFLVEGVFHIASYFQLRKLSGSVWLLFDGIVTIFLAFLIWIHWPSSAIWAIGTIVGVNLLMSGFTRLMYSNALKRAIG
jgi:uncharacterized membrane protein HdeD (DUF308 family)